MQEPICVCAHWCTMTMSQFASLPSLHAWANKVNFLLVCLRQNGEVLFFLGGTIVDVRGFSLMWCSKLCIHVFSFGNGVPSHSTRHPRFPRRPQRGREHRAQSRPALLRTRLKNWSIAGCYFGPTTGSLQVTFPNACTWHCSSLQVHRLGSSPLLVDTPWIFHPRFCHPEYYVRRLSL